MENIESVRQRTAFKVDTQPLALDRGTQLFQERFVTEMRAIWSQDD